MQSNPINECKILAELHEVALEQPGPNFDVTKRANLTILTKPAHRRFEKTWFEAVSEIAVNEE